MATPAPLLTRPAAAPLGPQAAAAGPGSSALVGIRRLVAGDFNADGKLDVVLADTFRSQPETFICSTAMAM